MITCKAMANGFEYIEINNATATAKIALQGAHLFEYTRHNETPILWVSTCTAFENGAAIRGGIPVCWPWFGMSENPDLPQHGFARTSIWKLMEQTENAQASTIILELQSTKSTTKLWPFEFTLRLHVKVGTTLELSLETLNRDSKTMNITQALHTYFTIDTIQNVSIRGLEHKRYFNALDKTFYTQEGAITFDKETDRIYQDVTWPLKIDDSVRTISINASNSTSCVVWNPWIEKCARMSGMCKESYQSMVCLETTNALKPTFPPTHNEAGGSISSAR